jgi:hypothetical protein
MRRECIGFRAKVEPAAELTALLRVLGEVESADTEESAGAEEEAFLRGAFTSASTRLAERSFPHARILVAVDGSMISTSL